jgi:hypothetical protein
MFAAIANYTSRLTACVTGAGAGVDNAWEQEKLEARKKLKIRTLPSIQCTRCWTMLAIGITFLIIFLNHRIVMSF